LPVLDCEHESVSPDHFYPVAPPKVDGVRDHDVAPPLGEGVRPQVDFLKHGPERVPQGLKPAMTAIEIFERPSGSGIVDFRIGPIEGQPCLQVSPVERFDAALHDLTFSSDIAYSDSPTASRARARFR